MKRRTVDEGVLWFFGIMTWLGLIPLVLNMYLDPSLLLFIFDSIWIIFWGGFYCLFKDSRTKPEFFSIITGGIMKILCPSCKVAMKVKEYPNSNTIMFEADCKKCGASLDGEVTRATKKSVKEEK